MQNKASKTTNNPIVTLGGVQAEYIVQKSESKILHMPGISCMLNHWSHIPRPEYITEIGPSREIIRRSC